MIEQNKASTSFAGTREQEDQLLALIQKHKDDKGALMPVMQGAQEIYGYLPFEVQSMIADGMNVPLQTVYGVSTFYSQFALTPKGKYKIGVCMGTACYVKDAAKVLDALKDTLGIDMKETTADGMFSIEDTRCLGCCGLAPVMMINDDVYGRLVADDIKGIVEKYKEMG